jgi:muramidase (phage lysozyme)
MAAPLLLPAIKALASGGLKKAAMGAAKGAVKGKAKDFVTGKNRKGKGKGGDLTKSEGGGEEQVEGGKGGAIVPTTPMVGNYKVETLPDKPDEVGKPSKVSYEAINNQLDSIIGLTNALKKSSTVKLNNDENRRKAERKASEKAKKRKRESLLEKGAGKALGMAGNLYGKATKGFDPLKFFTMIFLGSLFNWITTNGSKIIGFLKVGLALFNNAGKLLKSGFKFLGKVLKSGFKLIAKLPKAIKGIAKGVGKAILGVGRKLGSVFGKIGKSLKNLIKGLLNKIPGFPKPPTPRGPKPGKPGSKPGGKPGKPGSKPGKPGSKPGKPGKPGSKPGSQLLKGGVGRSTNRMIAKFGGKNALRATKALKAGLKRIPVIGPLITLLVSVLSGDPVTQTMFKTGGAFLGGFLGSFIPIPVVGTLIGELIGEYVGDLMYYGIHGGPDGETLNQKLKTDWDNALKGADFIGKGFGRLYEGLPKFKLPDLGFANPLFYGSMNLLLGATTGKKIQDVEFPNPLKMLNPFDMIPMIHQAFFTKDPMKSGEVKKRGKVDSNKLTGITNKSTVKRDTKDAKFGDFIMGSDGTLGVFDGMGTRGLKEGEQELFDSGAINIDGTKGSSTSVPTTSNASYWGPLLETIAKKESVGGSYDSIYPGTTKQKKYGGKALTEMTISEADAWQASTAGERGSAAAGRYQFMQILSQAKSAGLGGTDMFSPENQDKMAISLIVDKRKITPEMIKNNPNEAMIRLGMEWAAFPMPVDMKGHSQYVKAGQSYYAGDGRNASGATVDEMRAAFAKLGAPPVQSQQPQTPKVDLPETYTVAGVTYDVATGLPTSENVESQDQSDSDISSTPAPAKVSPSTSSQTQMSNGITGISQQLPYEESGNTVVMMQGSGGQQTPMSSGGGKGTPVMMGSGDVVNSYYKSQLMGFLYKQG